MSDTTSDKERRAAAKVSRAQMRSQLNPDQLNTLVELEHFGWELTFIRRKPFQPPLPVVVDAGRQRFAVLREDGTLDDAPGFDIRH
jgi:hypothetical protein